MFLAVSAALGAPPAPVEPRAEAARPLGTVLRPPPPPFDLSVDALTIEWVPAPVIKGVVRYQGSSPAAPGEHTFSCHLGYGDFPPGAFDPPSGGAYVFVPPSRQEDKWTHFHLKEAGTYDVSVPFTTVANEVLVRCVVPSVQGEADTANNSRKAFSHRPPPQGQPLRYILDVIAKPLNDPGNHVRITTRVTNPTTNLLQNLRLILVRNHVTIKEWMPLGMHPSALAVTHWDDAMPAEFATNSYEAILTTDTASPQPPPATILDRRSTSYRHAGTLHGAP
jgi:hypothetical protein